MADEATIQERVQELTWALVDDEINDDETRLLENLLLSDDQARATYVSCAQLHVDLLSHFAKPVAPAATGISPVLGFLGQAIPPFDVQPTQP